MSLISISIFNPNQFRVNSGIGTGGGTKTDEFSEKFQRAFDPPSLIFGNLYCKSFSENPCVKPCIKVYNINFWTENDTPPHPFGTFLKIHPFWYHHPALPDGSLHQNGWTLGNCQSVCVCVGVGHFHPKIYDADFGTLNGAFWAWNWYKGVISGFRVFQQSYW